MSAQRKMPLPADFKAMVEAEPNVTIAEWSARFLVTGTAVRRTARAAGIKIKRAPAWRKGHVGMRLTADHVQVAHAIVSEAAHRITEFRQTVETPEDRKVLDAAISGLDALETAFASGDTSFLTRPNLEQPQ